MPVSAAEVAAVPNPQDLIRIPTQVVKKQQTEPLKKPVEVPLKATFVASLPMRPEAEAVAAVHPDRSEAALFVEAVEAEIIVPST